MPSAEMGRLHELHTRQPDDDEHSVALLVMEAGAAWPPFAPRLRGHAPTTVVESQPSSERTEEFASRVIARIRELGARGVPIPVAALSLGACRRTAARCERDRIAVALLDALGSRGGELLVYAECKSSDIIRHEVLALAGALCALRPAQHVSVRILFATPAAESAPLWRARPKQEGAVLERVSA